MVLGHQWQVFHIPYWCWWCSATSRRLLPPGATSPSCPGAPRPSRQLVLAPTTTAATRRLHKPALISGRTEPPLGWEQHASSRKQVAAESGPPTRTPGKSMPASPPTPPTNRPPPPRIDDGRPRSLPPRHQAPPHYATPQCHCLRCTRGVSGLESFGVRCPAPLVPPDHLLPGALGHRSLHCLGAGPALDRGPPIQAPPAYCPPLLTQANLTIIIPRPSFQFSYLVYPTSFGQSIKMLKCCMKFSRGTYYKPI